MTPLITLYGLTLIALSVFSYGFVDLNLTLSTNSIYRYFQEPLSILLYQSRPTATLLFLAILMTLFFCYVTILRWGPSGFFISWKKTLTVLLFSAGVLVFSYPALTHDLFNYITTAKVAFTHRENPYVVMPIEIPNEPYLAFTRAANKYALYGPVWILLTALPHFLGFGNIWLTIVMFKGLSAVGYLLFCYFIYRVTKSVKNVLFFAFNPLVLIEVLVSGHNDIFMMLLALYGFFIWKKGRAGIWGLVSFFASWWIKAATIVLTPLFLLPRISFEKSLVIAYWLLFAVFIVVAPLREELYPWYAVWIIATASLLSFKSNAFIIGFTIVLSFALELRHLPYMWMGYYEGPGPALRFAVTLVPVAIFLLCKGLVRISKKRI